MAVLASYACHCTTLGGDFNRVHADWAGFAQAFIEADRLWINAYANDLPCYIASRRIYPQGGYEVDRSMIPPPKQIL